jgi:class 3 adenylate cyclase
MGYLWQLCARVLWGARSRAGRGTVQSAERAAYGGGCGQKDASMRTENVTVLFTDMVGSTASRLGPDAADELCRGALLGVPFASNATGPLGLS